MNLRTKSDVSIEINTCFSSKQQKLSEDCLAELKSDPTLLLDYQGIIRECSQSVEKQFGYDRSKLAWQHISCLFPQLSQIDLVREDRLNPLLSYICHCDYIFEAINNKSDVILCNLSLASIECDGKQFLRLVVRPYGKKNGACLS